MVRKRVALDEEAYDLLRSQKLPGESFSELVRRLARRRSFLDYAGAWRDVPEEDLEKLRSALRRGREMDRARVARRTRRRE